MSCPDCFKGSLDEGEPKGEETHGFGLAAYVSKPARPNGNAVVIATDIFGYKIPNPRLIADAFAAEGYLAVVPDLFCGDPADIGLMWFVEDLPSLSFMAWVLGHIRLLLVSLSWGIPFMIRHWPGATIPSLERLVQTLRSDHHINKVAVQGYCYGGKVAALLAGRGVVDAVAIAHPGMLWIPRDINAFRVPSLWQCADKDFSFSARQRSRCQKILEAKPGLPSRFVVYPGTIHGFAVRGSKKDPYVNQARAQALQDALDFFRDHLGA